MGARKQFLSPLKKGTFYLSATLLCIVAIYACRKMDSQNAQAQSRSATVTRFLTLPATATPEVKRIAAVLKQKNERAGFLNDMAKKDGFPVWDKVIVNTAAKANHRGANLRTNSSNDTIIYIPLVLDNANYVNAFIYARLHDSISLQLHRANNYESYGFGSIDSATNNAERLAFQFMMLDRAVFGHKKFKLLDKRLFYNANDPTNNKPNIKRYLEIKDGDSASTTASRFAEGSITHCVYSTSYHCTGDMVCIPNCDNCPLCVTSGWDCTTTVYYYFVDDLDGGGTGGGGGTGTGGGGGGGGNPDPNGQVPCNPNPLLDNGFLPCPEGNTTGWLPLSDPPKGTPCDKIKTVTDTATNPTFMQKAKDLATPQNLNLGYEKSVSLIDGGTPAVKEDSGTTAIASVQLPDVPGKKYTSFAHTHPNTSGGTYSIFSFGDLKRMSSLMNSGQLDPGKFVALLSTYKGTYYALTIDNASKLQDFFYYFNNTGNASQGNVMQWLNSQVKADNIERKYFNSKNPLILETDTNNSNILDKFLDFMKEADLGVTLFETNANFSSFTKVEKDAAGTIQRTNCN